MRGTVTYMICIHDQNGPKDTESQYHDIRQNKGNGNILVDYQITLSFSSLLHLDGPQCIMEEQALLVMPLSILGSLTGSCFEGGIITVLTIPYPNPGRLRPW